MMNNLLNISIKTYNQQQTTTKKKCHHSIFNFSKTTRIRIQIKEKPKKNYVEIYDVQQKKRNIEIKFMRNLKKNENAFDVTFMILVFVDVELCIKSLILGGFLFKKII